VRPKPKVGKAKKKSIKKAMVADEEGAAFSTSPEWQAECTLAGFKSGTSIADAVRFALGAKNIDLMVSTLVVMVENKGILSLNLALVYWIVIFKKGFRVVNKGTSIHTCICLMYFSGLD